MLSRVLDWLNIKNKPTTVSGYGITDAYKNPSYASGVGVAVGSWFQAQQDGFVTVVCWGPYMNGCEVFAGVSMSSYTRIAYMGDDINGNTKASSFSFTIKKDAWFYVGTSGFAGGFENCWVTFWPNV